MYIQTGSGDCPLSVMKIILQIRTSYSSPGMRCGHIFFREACCWVWLYCLPAFMRSSEDQTFQGLNFSIESKVVNLWKISIWKFPRQALMTGEAACYWTCWCREWSGQPIWGFRNQVSSFLNNWSRRRDCR